VFGLLAHASTDLADPDPGKGSLLPGAEPADHSGLRGGAVGTQSVIEFWGSRPELAARLAGSLRDQLRAMAKACGSRRSRRAGWHGGAGSPKPLRRCTAPGRPG